MRFVSSVATVEREVDSGAFTATIDTFAAGILKLQGAIIPRKGKRTEAVPDYNLHPHGFHQ